MEEKKFKISRTRSNSDKEEIISGTFEELKEVFYETLSTGNSKNPKIKKDPKNIKELMTAIQKSYNEMEKGMRSQTFVDIVK